jgi:hypothetical protein
MKREQAEAAIRAILVSIPDSQLPKGRMEVRDGETVLWFGGRGHHLGMAKRNGETEPDVHRSSGILDALEGEAIYRADVKFLRGKS